MNALVLEGGGFRGMFTAGVLDYFMEQKLDFDETIGVSMGALIGLNFVSKQINRSRDLALDFIYDKKYISYRNLILKGDLVDFKYVFDGEMNRQFPFDEEFFRKSKKSFFVNVFNLKTGMVEYHNTVQAMQYKRYIQASASLPIASKKVRIDGNLYFDGGVVDSIPFERAISDGATKIVLILTRTFEYRKPKQPALWLFRLRYLRYPKLYRALKKRHIRYNKLVKQAIQLEKEGKLLIIKPDNELGMGRLERDIEKLKYAYSLGYQKAKEVFSKVINYLNN